MVRMDSFKGATALPITFNDAYTSAKTAMAFLGYVADFMLMFARGSRWALDLGSRIGRGIVIKRSLKKQDRFTCLRSEEG